MAIPEKIAVLGAGTMGHGIAQVAAQHGIETALFDPSPEALARGLAAVRTNLEGGVARGKVTEDEKAVTLARLRGETTREAALAGAELVVEAAPEDLALKKRIFTELGALPVSVLLATNTSSLPVGEIAASARHSERVLGMHFFNPVHLMPLLEIVRADATSESTVNRALEVGRALGKECIVVRDRPGFATSRLGVVLGLEAIRMLEEGVASAEDIDKAMTLGYRHPLGPLRLTDLVGLDVRLAIAEHLHRTLGSEAFRPPEILRRLVQEGKLGKKSGEGFYRWS
jgi:3-hydroxybutyryl-CoA dehydrogenase